MKRDTHKSHARGAAGHRIGKCVIKGIDSTVNFAVLCIFFLLFFYGCYAVWDTNTIFETADAARYEIYKPTQEDSLSFGELIQINKDVFGWLTVYGTNIDYPLLQTDNNETYINTDAEGNYSVSGSLFLDCRNQKDFSDFNHIIYGHHMEKQAMFGEIGYFEKEDYFEEHKYGNLYREGKDYGLEFFAFLSVESSDSVYTLPVIEEEAKTAYLNDLREKAVWYRELGVSTEDHLVLLSTCSSVDTVGRHILVGRICDNTFPNTLNKETDDFRGTGVDQFSWKELFNQLPVWLWTICLFAFLLLVTLIYDRSVKKKAKKHTGKGEDKENEKKKYI